MRVIVDEGQLQVHLARWEKVLGLMRDIKLPLSEIRDVEVVEDSVRTAMQGGLKVGFRLPWLCYVARSIKLDQAFIVRRRVPALSFDVVGHPVLKHVVVSTPDAHELAEQLGTRGAA